MLWKEGLLIRLNQMGIDGRLFNWTMDFLKKRRIQVVIKNEYSDIYKIENGTPQGIVCSPILFNIMINGIFENIGPGIGRSRYADDGALWIRGKNLKYLQGKMQKAIEAVEKWTNQWGFRVPVEKSPGHLLL